MTGTPSVHFGIRRGFSLIEVLIAIFILGIGTISIAALFPAGIAQQRRSVDDVIGPIVANNAMSIIRSKVRSEQFGTFEEFAPTAFPLWAPRRTVPGDWPWLRPSFLFGGGNSDVDETGAIDIFSNEWATKGVGARATEFPDGYGNSLPLLHGIPYHLTDVLDDVLDRREDIKPPRVIITREERYFPQQSQRPALLAGNEPRPTPPEYVWECMFRRFNGQIYVAVFVYRVSSPGGERTAYTVVANENNPAVPPLPIWLDLSVTQGRTEPWRGELWDTFGADFDDPGDDAFIPGTEPNTEFDATNDAHAWQLPGQWLVDQNNNVMRVLSGRRNEEEGPVELVRPVPAVPVFMNNNIVYPDLFYYDDLIPKIDRIGFENVVTDIWFLPRTDSAERTLTPVFVTVQAL